MIRQFFSLHSRVAAFSAVFRIRIRIRIHPYVFRPPGSESGSVVYFYVSGSFHQQAKKFRIILISSALFFMTFFICEECCKCTFKNYSHKKIFFVGILMVTDEKRRIRQRIRIRIRIRQSQVRIRGSGSAPKCHGSGTRIFRVEKQHGYYGYYG